jgi:alpha-beta hydrolase superfamily lysophospholipase
MKKRITASVTMVLIMGAAAASVASIQEQGVRPLHGGAVITNPPGSIVSATRFRIPVPGARAWRVLYRSSGVDGEQVVDSGVIVAPAGTPPPGGWPVVAWAHPTTGIARKCAPSLGAHFDRTVPEMAELVRRGFVVAATDYQGLGTEGPHPYLVGTSAAYSILDSVRAARWVAGASARYVVWGHSQGGHAALWAGQLATQYAPDLSLLGVAAAAPATELAQLFEDDQDTPGGKAFSALALLSWSKVYGLDLSTVIAPKAMGGTRLIGDACMTDPLGLMVDGIGLHMLPSEFLRADPTRISPWRDIIARNTPSSVVRGVPVLLAQGTADTVISPAVTRDFAARLCRDGTPVRLVEMNADHLGIAVSSASRIVDWITARFAGNRAERECMVPPLR